MTETATSPAKAATLQDWVMGHGPIAPQPAIVMALDACTLASRLPRTELGRSIASLSRTGITRSAEGWTWHPVHTTEPMPRVDDADVLQRLGGVLFFALTGEPIAESHPTEPEVRGRLRALRPDLPPGVAEVTARAVTARRGSPETIEQVAGDLRQLLGVERPARSDHRRRATVIAMVVALLGSAFAAARVRSDDRVLAHGFTARETALLDITREVIETFGRMDEHTAAVQLIQLLVQRQMNRLKADDPRLALSLGLEAWIRTLAGDRLTAEQNLQKEAPRLERQLGGHHPYTRSARLSLAETLEARGAVAEAAALREDATRAAAALLGESSTQVWDGTPVMPGVLAHLAPNDPVREGFRPVDDGGFAIPLTSVQRTFAGQRGWRLHVVANDTCRVIAISGDTPRAVGVRLQRAADASWEVQIDGVTPAVALRTASGDSITISLLTDDAGRVITRAAGHEAVAQIDSATPPPQPPYALTFNGTASACRLVWMEIPFPNTPIAPPAPAASTTAATRP